MIGGEAFMTSIKNANDIPSLPKDVIKFRNIVSHMKHEILKKLEDKSKWGKDDAHDEQKFIDAGDRIVQLGNIIMHILKGDDNNYLKEIDPVIEYFCKHRFDFSLLDSESLSLCIYYVEMDTKVHTFDLNGHSSALIKD